MKTLMKWLVAAPLHLPATSAPATAAPAAHLFLCLCFPIVLSSLAYLCCIGTFTGDNCFPIIALVLRF